MSTNREIKFRYVCEDLAGNIFFIYKHITDFLNEGMNKHGRIQRIIAVNQSTGLIDREGEEIYDDDIVKFHYFYGTLGGNGGFVEAEHELTGRVCWGNYGWAIESISGTHWQGYTGYCAGDGESSILDLFAMDESSIHDESFKVIGTVHTDPSLLKS